MYDKLLKILGDCLRLVKSKSTAQNRSNHREKNPQVNAVVVVKRLKDNAV
jgi:hypothetical protein